uniref:Putative lipocalin-2 1 n=1 Tax=Amblyomma triste TaxID=251400 RepID=A0A023G9T7_AMBTT
MCFSTSKGKFASVLVLLFCNFVAGAEVSEENHLNYVADQDIYKAFEMGSEFWLWAVNFPRGPTSNRRCTLFRKHALFETGMNYSSHYLINDTWHEMKYTGQFYKTELKKGTESATREKYNAMLASETTETWHPRKYILLFSDYTDCLLLHVPGIYSGFACMVLVIDPPPSQSQMPEKCKNMFEMFCRYGTQEQIYESSCTKPQINFFRK